MVLTQWETLCGLFFAFFEKIVVPILTSGGLVRLLLRRRGSTVIIREKTPPRLRLLSQGISREKRKIAEMLYADSEKAGNQRDSGNGTLCGEWRSD